MGGRTCGKTGLHMSSGSVAFSFGTIYLLGEVAGALFFGRLSDKWGRKNLFMITLGVYLFGGVLVACTAGTSKEWVIWLDAARFIGGMGIGGEYAAINSAIDELIPAKYRGRVDIGVNGTYWGGALIASLFVQHVIFRINDSYSWRIAFLLGPALAFVILIVRRNLPESPRWLVMHGRHEEAEKAIAASGPPSTPEATSSPSTRPRPSWSRRRPTSGSWPWPRTCSPPTPGGRSWATLMITQSFLYNAIFFTYTLVLTKIYHVGTHSTGNYFVAFAAGNLVGPLLLGRFFDTIGRRKMIAGTTSSPAPCWRSAPSCSTPVCSMP